MLKIATWNVNSLRVRLEHTLNWLQTSQPDILALQEIKMINDDFPVEAFQSAGYHVIANGQKTYNGVALLSRLPLDKVEFAMPNWPDEQRRVIAGTFNNIRIINLYVPNGESVSSEKYQYKLQWLEACRDYLKQALQQYQQVVVVGDFNIAPADEDVHDPIAWQGQVLVSEPERKALQEILALGFQDSFRLFPQSERTYSWWDYRAAAFRRNMGLRIDHILLSHDLADHCKVCAIDKAPRKWERPSDHAPVMATLVL